MVRIGHGEGPKTMPDYSFLADLRREVEIPRDGILSRTLFSDEWLKAVVFGFDAGQELSEHTAAMPAVIHVLEGDRRSSWATTGTTRARGRGSTCPPGCATR